MLTGMNVRAAALACCALVPAVLVACGVEPGSGACTETSIAAPPATLPAATSPLRLPATLTAGDSPVAGAELAYFVRLKKPDGKVDSVRMGETTTGSNGVATFERRDGVDGLGFSDEKADGYTVEYNPLTKIDDTQYCRSRATATLTVG
jgi:hypothetical protein